MIRRVRPRPTTAALAVRLLRDTGAPGQRQQGGRELGIGQRCEPVEQRHDQDREQRRQRDADDEEHRGRDQPPPPRGAEQSVDHQHAAETEHRAERGGLGAIEQPRGETLVQEPEASRQPEAAHPAQRERQD
jgi:hypothetical protein